MKRHSRLLLALIVIMSIGTAHAIPVPVTIDFQGMVTEAFDFNGTFGLSTLPGSNTISGTVAADVDLDLVGVQTILADMMTVDFTIGDFEFDQNSSLGFPFFPQLTFLDGLYQDFAYDDFSGSGIVFGTDAGTGLWTAIDIDGLGALGTMSVIVTEVVTAVPEPGSLALLGLGLLGMGAVRRRKLALTQ